MESTLHNLAQRIGVDNIMCDVLDAGYEAAIRDNRVAAHRPIRRSYQIF